MAAAQNFLTAKHQPIVVYPVNWTLKPQTPMALAFSRLPWNFIIGGALAVSALLLIAEER
jgi:hypothetical protein